MDKDLRNSTDPTIELHKINARIEEIERLGTELAEKRRHVIDDPDEEQDLMITHMELTEEKAALVRRLDYFNGLADLNETKEKLASIRNQLANISM